MDRQAILKAGGAAFLGLGLGGCRPARAPLPAAGTSVQGVPPPRT